MVVRREEDVDGRGIAAVELELRSKDGRVTPTVVVGFRASQMPGRVLLHVTGGRTTRVAADAE